MPNVLGIDTSCDDTGVGICSGGLVRANVVLSQTALHTGFGGVVPEAASREHLDVIDAVVERALETAGLQLRDIDAVAATRGPGLVGALLVGLSYAKALAWGLEVPFVPIHHLEGHLAAAAAANGGREGGRETAGQGGQGAAAEPPFLALIASGGHTALFKVSGWDDIEELGHTLDDAAGEAFDKVARMIGLGYPGGAALAKLAESGDDTALDLPWPLQGKGGLDFSFSGLKTAVAQLVARDPGRPAADIAASFERVAIGSLVEVTLRAARLTGLNRLVVAGGVAANRRLRDALDSSGLETHFPPAELATDNGAMIALAAELKLARRDLIAAALETDAAPYLPLARAPGPG